jgi:PST family polysaccharide transporter
MAFATMPVAAGLLVCSDNLVQVALGDQWATSAEIFAVLAVTGFVQPAASTRGLVLMSTGKDQKYLRLGVWNAVVTVIGFLIGIGWGPVGVAVAYGVVNYVVLYPSLRYSFGDSPVKVSDFFRSVGRPAMSSSVAALLTWFLKQGLAEWGDLVTLVLCGLAFVVLYLLAFAVLPGGASELRGYLSFRSYFVPSSLSPEVAKQF